jgi:hypothetical protein
VVKIPAALAARHGSGHPLAGTFAGTLDKAGERIRLADAAGETLLDFRYQPAWFPPAAGWPLHAAVSQPDGREQATFRQPGTPANARLFVRVAAANAPP